MMINQRGRRLLKKIARPRVNLEQADLIIRQTISVPLHENEYNALVSLVSGIGEPIFRRSKVVSFINEGRRISAADYMLRYTRNNKRAAKLRKEERELFLTPAIVSTEGERPK